MEDRERLAAELRTYDETSTEATADSDSGSLGATADLMGKLLQVPKDEADEVHRGHQGD